MTHDRYPVLRAPTRCWAAFAILIIMAGAPAFADGKIDINYTASLAGIPIGTGALRIDFGAGAYSASGNGHITGLLRILSSTQGSVAARGRLIRDGIVPDLYQASVSTSQLDYDVRMVLKAGTVKELIAEPPFVPSPDRVPLTENHRRNIVDPVTALIMPVTGAGEVMSANACERTLPIFDGHQRFDIVLSFKRTEMVRAETGYEGPVLVCAAEYRPVAGHRPDRFAVKYLQEQRDMEVWLAPVAETRLLVPFRISVPTLLGTAIIEATQFVAESAPALANAVAHRHATKPSASEPLKLVTMPPTR